MVATVASQSVSPPVQEQIAALELGHLSAETQDKVRALIGQYSSIFSTTGTWGVLTREIWSVRSDQRDPSLR